MADLYAYIPSESLEDAILCGLKLSEWHGREIVIHGERCKAIPALLHPKDDMDRYGSASYECIRIEVDPGICYVAEGGILELCKSRPELSGLYEESIIPLKDYAFGSFRHPEVLIAGSVMAESISWYSGKMDAPLLFENSGTLYVRGRLESYRQEFDDFDDSLLYYFYDAEAKNGKFEKIEDSSGGMVLFRDRASGVTYLSKIPAIEGMKAMTALEKMPVDSYSKGDAADQNE